MRFSERMGLKQVKSVIQIDSIDEDLLNGLWNAIMEFYLSKYFDTPVDDDEVNHETVAELSKKILGDHLKKRLDKINFISREPIQLLKGYLYDKDREWYEIYDLVEFIANNFEQEFSSVNDEFMDHCNKVLEMEVSGFRFVSGQIVPITTTEEVEEIEDAINNPDTSGLVKTHLSNSLKHMAERGSPDYRTSIKESISAVECLVKAIVGDPSTTLGAALRKIEQRGQINFHTDLNLGLTKIYHYTSDSDGIRHALKEAPTVDFEDAKFMLVMCSSFCNYLTVKANKAGISVT